MEASKIAAKKLTSEYEKTGSLPPETPIFEGDGIRLFADAANTAALASVSKDSTLAGFMRTHLERLGPGDYLALLAYIQMNAEHDAVLQKMRLAVRDRKKVATCVGFGPRFLHSTGQAYKGGPNSGVFLQITCDDAERSAGAGPEVYLRRGEGGAGARRFRGIGRAQTPRVARAPGA